MSVTVKTRKLGLGAFDLCKGLAMISVVVGHMASYYDLSRLTVFLPVLLLVRGVAFAAMPMFFLVSGFYFKPKPVDKVLKKSFQSLIIPYLYVMVAIVLIAPVVHWLQWRSVINAIKVAAKWFLGFMLGLPVSGKEIFGYSLSGNSATWFFLALFWAQNLMNAILKIKNEKMQYAAIGLCLVVGFVLMKLGIVYFCIAQALVAVTFCYWGYILKKYNLIDYLLSSKVALILLAVISVVFTAWGEFNIANSWFKCFPLDYIGALCAAVLYLLINCHIGQYELRALDWMRKIGIYSYWILCVHSAEMQCIPWYKFNALMGPEYQPLFFVAEIILKATILTAFCLIMSKITKMKYRRKMSKHA